MHDGDFFVYFRFNVRYGRMEATDAEVIEAAKNADIHEKILTFPDSYDTEVDDKRNARERFVSIIVIFLLKTISLQFFNAMKHFR